jgi:hypothetical protein
MEQHRRADSDRQAIDRGDHRLRHVGQAPDEVQRWRRNALAARILRAANEIVDVIAGIEHAT